MKRGGLKVLGFDLDDTLYAEHDYMLGGFQAISEYAATHLGIADFDTLLLKIKREEQAAGRTINLALDHLEFHYDETLVQTMVSIYHNGRRGLALDPYPDVIPALQRLHSEYKLVLITDGEPEVQSNKIHALGLDQKFDEIYCTGRFGREFWKPSPFAFQKTMTNFAVSGRSCGYIGNDPQKDFLAPNRLSWLTIQIERPEPLIKRSTVPTSAYEAHQHITNLDELETLLSENRCQ